MGLANFPKEFDYIIVGAGSAGSVLAGSLVEFNAGRILIVESGTSLSHQLSLQPVTYPHLFFDPAFSFADRTISQRHLAQRRLLIPSGRGLGGSSLINAMILASPHQADFDRWQQHVGPTWSFENFAQSLKWLEDRLAASIDPQPYLSPLSEQLLQSIDTMHHKGSQSEARLSEEGLIVPYRRMTRHGRRLSAWKFMGLDKEPTDLYVLRQATVEEIEWKDQRAVSVAVRLANQALTISFEATKAIIISAGTLRSPVILMRSGIGPSDDFGISRDLRVDAPRVGKNLHDHLVFPITYATDLPILPSRFSETHLKLWKEEGHGPLASNIAELGALGYCPSEQSLQLITTSCTIRPSIQWHITPTHYLEYPTKEIPTQAFSVGVTTLHPKSRGELKLRFNGDIEIDPGYLSCDQDLDDLLNAVFATRKWVEQSPWNRFVVSEILPGSKRKSDDQVRMVIERFVNTIYHYVGTSACGTSPQSVCDPHFRVRGCENLYVCDASCLPEIGSGNTQMVVMMLARQLAKQLVET